MHPLTIEKSSSPATIYARVGASQVTKGISGLGIRGSGFESPNANHYSPQSPKPETGISASARSLRTPNTESRTPSFQPPRFIVTLDAPLAAGEALARIPIAITGKWVRDGNDFSITLADLEEIVRNFNGRRNGEINVDYDHASEMPEVGAGGPVPSAGRIVELEEPRLLGTPHPPSYAGRQSITWGRDPLPGGEGGERSETGEGSRWILYGSYDPTPRARKLIESREYRYISPAINWAGRDKRTGKMTGTTLTSVALTNRPFLEELPQIRLSDPAYQLVDIGDVHVETALGTQEEKKSEVRSQKSEEEQPATNSGRSSSSVNRQSTNGNLPGGKMKQVKLSVQDGQIKVAHDDLPDGYFADPAEVRQCMEDLGGDSGALALAAEIESMAGLPGHAESGGASATLSECVAEIRRRLAPHQEISLKEAAALLSENEAGGKSIAAADYFRWRVEQELDEAVKNGKVLPRQRDDWRKIALSDFPTFRKIVAEQKPQVPLRPVGLGGSGPEDAQTQVKLLAEQRMRERQISFGQALSEIGREQPELVHQYRRAVSA